MKKKGFTLIELIVVVTCVFVLAAIIVPAVAGMCNKETVTVTVTDKGIKRYDDVDKYLIYTNETTYQIADSFIDGNWNSSDLYGSIVIGETYTFTTRGYRVGFLSMYPNIIEVEEVDEKGEIVDGKTS